jgi:L-histidine Nalpha-methyltransferase
MLLIGIDRIKESSVLLCAYDDASGVTAAFNLNLLHRINREPIGSMPVEAFRHRARWNASETRIEMHLEAVASVGFTIARRVCAVNALLAPTDGTRRPIRAFRWTSWQEPLSAAPLERAAEH